MDETSTTSDSWDTEEDSNTDDIHLNTSTNDIYENIKKHIENECKSKLKIEMKKLKSEYREKERRFLKQQKKVKEDMKTLEDQEKSIENQYLEYKRELDLKEKSIRMAQKYTGKDKVVSINMGGEIFHSLHSTFSSISPFFGNLLSDKFGEPITDKEGNIFIDRPPAGFKEILDWAKLGKSDKFINKVVEIYKTSQKWSTSAQHTLEYDMLIENIDYFGITFNNSIIEKGKKIQIYWRGDKTMYEGTILSSPSPSDPSPCIVVKYDDGQIWKYNHMKIHHKTGPYSKYSACSCVKKKYGSEPKYWHYDSEKGATQLKKYNDE